MGRSEVCSLYNPNDRWDFCCGQADGGKYGITRNAKKLALSNPVFIHNHEIRQYAVMFQVAATIFILIISVLKPWRKKNVKVKNS